MKERWNRTEKLIQPYFGQSDAVEEMRSSLLCTLSSHSGNDQRSDKTCSQQVAALKIEWCLVSSVQCFTFSLQVFVVVISTGHVVHGDAPRGFFTEYLIVLPIAAWTLSMQ